MNKITLRPFEDFKTESFAKNPKLKKAYDALEEEFSLAEAVIKKRIEKGLTQKQLADRAGTKQSAIARLESGNYNPSFAFLRKIAGALDTKVKITL